ncbi:MAG: glyoxalase/bleomycin resistance protein/dioxygenase, partial [Chloroflexi bacterium]|nr:glyoxalase/bleomycin resistance protein/dioxygenase [Chloroflexota bacterium]
AISAAHMECRSIAETVPALCGTLAFEPLIESGDPATLKHPNTDWLLMVHEAPHALDKEMHNHFGVRVASTDEVDAAFSYLNAHQDTYRLSELQSPAWSHGSYSVYFREPGTNGLEIECYEAVLRKESGGTRLGGVRAPHWETRLPPERFPGRGYVPQAFTHGTLACGDISVSGRFYEEVLGLDAIRAYERILYVKHPDARHYIVCGQRASWTRHSRSFRFTLSLASPDDVAEAHHWLARSRTELGVTELDDMQTEENSAHFLLADPDGNWWEIRA